MLEKMRWRAFRLAPNLIRSPGYDEEYRVKRDRDSNEETRVDEAQRLRVATVWGVEVFGPSESDRLYESLNRLGWSAGMGSSPGEAETWVRQQRTYGQGGWYNVGTVDREEAPSRPGGTNRCRLPRGVEYLLVRLIQITPTVTCVIICFSLFEEHATVFERELNLDRRSRMEGRGGRIWEMSPYHLKESAIRAARMRFRNSVWSWFRENLPGYFSTSVPACRFPFGELLTTESVDVLSQGKDFDTDGKWPRLIAKPWPHEVWSSEDMHGLRFMMQLSSGWKGDEDENLLLANVVASRVPASKLEMYGGRPGAIEYMAHEALDGVLAYLGVEAYMAEAAKDVKATREALNLARGKHGTLRTIELVRGFFDRNAGVPAIARELRDMTARPNALEHYAGKFTAPGWSQDGEARSFASDLREGMNHRAEQLLAFESAAREHFGQLATILSTRESIRAQRRMEVLTVAALLVAAASLVAALPDSWREAARQVFANVWR